MSSLVSVGCDGVERWPFAGMYRGLWLPWRSLMMYEGGGLLTTAEEMIWYMVLWFCG